MTDDDGSRCDVCGEEADAFVECPSCGAYCCDQCMEPGMPPCSACRGEDEGDSDG